MKKYWVQKEILMKYSGNFIAFLKSLFLKSQTSSSGIYASFSVKAQAVLIQALLSYANAGLTTLDLSISLIFFFI